MKRGTSLRSRHFWRILSAFLLFFQVVGSVLFVSSVFAAASPSNILSYQGRLLNSNRVPVSDTSATVIFELYTASSGGSCVWSNSSASCATATGRTVTLTDGLFSENLGDTAASPAYAAIADTVFGDNASIYLQITVNGEALTPRKLITAAPYSLNSQLLDGLNQDGDGSTFAAIVSYNSSGNLNVTGNPGSGISNASVYINPASGDVAANDIIFGVGNGGSVRMTVDGEGDTVLGGVLTVAGGVISSASTMDLFDSASDATTIDFGGVTNDRANTLNIATNATSADVITVGNSHASTTLALTSGTWSVSTLGVGAFSNVNCSDCIDWSDFSDSATLDASTTANLSSSTLTFDANGAGNLVANLSSTGDFIIQDGGTAFVTFSDTAGVTVADAYAVGSASRLGQTAFNSTVTGTWSGSLGSRDVFVANISAEYQANEATGTDGRYAGLNISTQTSSGGDVNTLYSLLATTTNGSTDASAIEGEMFGVAGYTINSQAVTVPVAQGLYGQVSGSAGTITTGYAVRGLVASAAGSFTTAYGGYFENLNEGTTRYGVVGNASGGTNNYSGYFTQSLVLIDDNTIPTDTTPSYGNVSGGGDLFILDSLEANGSLYMGDSTGTDEFVFASGATTSTVFSLAADSLTSGTGFYVARGDGVATDFTGTLADIHQARTSAGSTGTAFRVRNFAGGNSSAAYIVQDQVVNATTAPTAQALVIDVNEVAGNDEVIIIRSDADNSSAALDTEFRFENDGDLFGDGAAYNAGADYAEFFSATDRTLGDYEVICWNPSQENGVRRCAAGDTNIVGVVSTNPGFVGNNLVGAEGNLEDNPEYVLVGLVGQIDTYVSADAGPIAVGDPLTTSSSRAGYGARTTGGTFIIGRALEALPSGTGIIKVLVQPMWYGGEMLTMDGEATSFSDDVVIRGEAATASVTAVDSAGLSFVGSTWNGSGANDVSLMLRNHILDDGTSRLSLANDDGVDVMTFGSTGDLALAGNLYPSDRGALQYGAYVYYDSTGAGYMKTNASGWSSRSTNFAEMFASADPLSPGDVVEFADDGTVRLSLGAAYSDRIAGVVSSGSGFIAGSNSGSYPVAISGRVSTKVTTENGAIAPGDALTTSSRPGYAMKATASGHIIGYALASMSEEEGSVLAFMRPQYVSTGEIVAQAPQSIAVNSQDIENLNVSGVLSMNGGDIVSVGTLSGIGTWEIRENGDIVTNGQLTQVVQSLQHTRVSTYAMTSTETLVQLSGTATMHNGMARVTFENVDPEFNDIISPEESYRVLVTPNGVTGQLYVTDRSNAGFMIRDADGGEGVSVDWLVLAYRHDLVPEREEVVQEEDISESPEAFLDVIDDEHEVASEEEILEELPVEVVPSDETPEDSVQELVPQEEQEEDVVISQEVSPP